MPNMDAPSGPGNRSWVSITVVTTTLSMAFTAVCLRFYTRGVLLKQLGIDDYVMLVALVSALLDMLKAYDLILASPSQLLVASLLLQVRDQDNFKT